MRKKKKSRIKFEKKIFINANRAGIFINFFPFIVYLFQKKRIFASQKKKKWQKRQTEKYRCLCYVLRIYVYSDFFFCYHKTVKDNRSSKCDVIPILKRHWKFMIRAKLDLKQLFEYSSSGTDPVFQILK